MATIRKILSWILLLLAVAVAVDAAAFFTIVFWPESAAGRWLARHEPVFNLLRSSGLGPPPEPEPAPPARGEYRVRLREGTHWVVVFPGHPIFAEPDIESPVIGQAQRRLRLPALDERDGWFQLEFSFGRGWVHSFAGARMIEGPVETAPPTTGAVGGDAADSGSGEMRVEIRIEPDYGRRPDAIYFEHLGARTRPLVYGELFSRYSPIDLARLPVDVDPERLQLATVLLGEEARQSRAGRFILRYRDRHRAGRAEAALAGLSEAYLELFRDFESLSASPRIAFVFLLPDLETYRRFFPRARVGDGVRGAGHYEAGIIAVHTELGPGGEPLRTLIHEAVHHLNRTALGLAGDGSALWLDEGLADYFAHSRLGPGGHLYPGEFDRTPGTARAASGVSSTRLVRNVSSPRERILRLRTELARGARIGLGELLWETGREEFYGGDSFRNYTLAWLLTLYLLEGDGGAYRDRFLGYIEEAAGGRGGREAFERALGVTAAELEGGLRTYILGL